MQRLAQASVPCWNSSIAPCMRPFSRALLIAGRMASSLVKVFSGLRPLYMGLIAVLQVSGVLKSATCEDMLQPWTLPGTRAFPLAWNLQPHSCTMQDIQASHDTLSEHMLTSSALSFSGFLPSSILQDLEICLRLLTDPGISSVCRSHGSSLLIDLRP